MFPYGVCFPQGESMRAKSTPRSALQASGLLARLRLCNFALKTRLRRCFGSLRKNYNPTQPAESLSKKSGKL